MHVGSARVGVRRADWGSCEAARATKATRDGTLRFVVDVPRVVVVVGVQGEEGKGKVRE